MGNVLICKGPRKKSRNVGFISETAVLADEQDAYSFSFVVLDEDTSPIVQVESCMEDPHCQYEKTEDYEPQIWGARTSGIRMSDCGGDGFPESESEPEYSSEYRVYFSSPERGHSEDNRYWASLRKLSDISIGGGSDTSISGSGVDTNISDCEKPTSIQFHRAQTEPIAQEFHGFRIGESVMVTHKKLKHHGNLGVIDKWCPVRNRFRVNIYNDQAYMKPEDLTHAPFKPIDRVEMRPQ